MTNERKLPASAHPSRNVLGEPLKPCSFDPQTGWFRNGCCDTDDSDVGSHTVCVRVTAAFLSYSASVGNDLSTSRGGFVGLQPGDQWCLCAPRWAEAFAANAAPHVVLASTHEGALEHCSLDDLMRFALDVS
ncbi:MAG TPA: DUF2237 domain-containing protein [Myxococcota bacterium]